jgi:leucyl aminopeptidase
MDFGHRVAPAQGLAKLEVDALVLVVAAGPARRAPRRAARDLLADAVAQGDLALKKGKSLYLHRPAGFAAQRSSSRSPADAVGEVVQGRGRAGLRALKGGGAKSLAVAWAGRGSMSDASCRRRGARPGRRDLSLPAHQAERAGRVGRESLTLVCQKSEAEGGAGRA